MSDAVKFSYSYMNRARKYSRKAWLADRRGDYTLGERYDRLRCKYENMSAFHWYY